jgi:hypothetical protein
MSGSRSDASDRSSVVGGEIPTNIDKGKKVPDGESVKKSDTIDDPSTLTEL